MAESSSYEHNGAGGLGGLLCSSDVGGRSAAVRRCPPGITSCWASWARPWTKSMEACNELTLDVSVSAVKKLSQMWTITCWQPSTTASNTRVC
eukprot:837497-Pyramimonas_sp.AAC.1